MTKLEALKELEKMSDKEFNVFFERLPARTRLLIRGGVVSWREVLPDWYIKIINKQNNE